MKLQDLLDAQVPTVAELALKYQVPVSEVQAELQKGMQVELEHTSHEHVARRIALAHLAERLDYYDQLAKVDEDSTRTSKRGAPGTLKAKISRLYGGAITCAKAQKLKMRSGATAHDKAQVNWYQNMHCGGATKVMEIFQEPARAMNWLSYGSGEDKFWQVHFTFDQRQVSVEMHPDVRQVSGKYVFNRNDENLPPNHKGWIAIFRVDNQTDVTHEMGPRAAPLFSKVVSVIKHFLQTHAWHYVLFTGESGSRNKLYRALAERLAQQAGGRVLHYQSDFVIVRHPVMESTDSHTAPHVNQRVDEIFQEPATPVQWQSHGADESEFWQTEFDFDNKPVVIEIHPDVNQSTARFVFQKQMKQLPHTHKGWMVIFRVDGVTDVTHTWGTRSVRLFTQVVSRVRHFLQTHDWHYVIFSGAPGSRDRFYKALAERLAHQAQGGVIQFGHDFVIHKSDSPSTSKSN
jgi:predicted RNase H-related nuclease YkuK (DUF458 family)